jgi:septum formation protein
MPAEFVYLASGSPRRRELLRQIGVPFKIIGAGIDESVQAGEPASGYVSRLAAAKAQAGWGSVSDAPVLAADTAVILDDEILGKPAGREQALQMLLALSGRTHEVLTAVAVRTAAGIDARISRSQVTFRGIDPAEARAYWETGEPHDKAGAYAIQGAAAVFIAELRGSYSGVMGLPLYETAELLQAAGVARWQAGTPT